MEPVKITDETSCDFCGKLTYKEGQTPYSNTGGMIEITFGYGSKHFDQSPFTDDICDDCFTNLRKLKEQKKGIVCELKQ